MTEEALAKAYKAASGIRAHYDHAASNIREDRSLSQEGKRDALAAAWGEHKAKLDAIEADYRQERQRLRGRLEDRVFRPTASGSATEAAARTASYRDALARADDIGDDSQALAALERARRTGDDDLLRAIGVVAMERGWIDTLNAYIEARPAEGRAIEDLFAMRRQDNDPGWLLHEAMALHPIAPNPAPEQFQLARGGRR